MGSGDVEELLFLGEKNLASVFAIIGVIISIISLLVALTVSLVHSVNEQINGKKVSKFLYSSVVVIVPVLLAFFLTLVIELLTFGLDDLYCCVFNTFEYIGHVIFNTVQAPALWFFVGMFEIFAISFAVFLKPKKAENEL